MSSWVNIYINIFNGKLFHFLSQKPPILTKQRQGSLKEDERDTGEVFLGSSGPWLLLKRSRKTNPWSWGSLDKTVHFLMNFQPKETGKEGEKTLGYGEGILQVSVGLKIPLVSKQHHLHHHQTAANFLKSRKKPASLFWAEVCPVCTVHFLLLVQEILCWVTGLTQIQSPAKLG